MRDGSRISVILRDRREERDITMYSQKNRTQPRKRCIGGTSDRLLGYYVGR